MLDWLRLFRPTRDEGGQLVGEIGQVGSTQDYHDYDDDDQLVGEVGQDVGDHDLDDPDADDYHDDDIYIMVKCLSVCVSVCVQKSYFLR